MRNVKDYTGITFAIETRRQISEESEIHVYLDGKHLGKVSGPEDQYNESDDEELDWDGLACHAILDVVGDGDIIEEEMGTELLDLIDAHRAKQE